MDPLHAVYLTVGLFVITFFNPGANLFVVVQTSLASGRRAGVLTGLGVALGVCNALPVGLLVQLLVYSRYA